jgi:hypothetical protein
LTPSPTHNEHMNRPHVSPLLCFRLSVSPMLDTLHLFAEVSIHTEFLLPKIQTKIRLTFVIRLFVFKQIYSPSSFSACCA